MAGARQPIALVQAKGKKHLTKAEIKAREAAEVKPCADDLSAPSYLTAAEKKRFNKIVEQLDKIKIVGETDTETISRYITAQTQYESVTKDLRALMKQKPKSTDADYYNKLDIFIDSQMRLAKLQDRYFAQAQTAASSLGLTISSRCKLQMPVAEEAPKVNKFAKFADNESEGGET